MHLLRMTISRIKIETKQKHQAKSLIEMHSHPANSLELLPTRPLRICTKTKA